MDREVPILIHTPRIMEDSDEVTLINQITLQAALKMFSEDDTKNSGDKNE
jgi:hypothetical protein